MRWIVPLLLCAQVFSARLCATVTIVEASYGAEGTFADVSTQVQSLLSSGANEFRVDNGTMGGDPIFGKVKSLRLVYRDESGTHEATVREGDTFRLGMTETSLLPDAAKVNEAPKPKPKVTANGVSYIDAELIKEYPKSVFISHASGKTFVKKADISTEDARALGITSPVADPAVPPATARTLSTPEPPQRVIAPRPTPHPSSIAAIQQEFHDFLKGGDQQQVSRASAQVDIPNQEYIEHLDSQTARLRLFEQGLLPLTRDEAITLFSGGKLGLRATRISKEGFTAARFLLGLADQSELSRPYRESLERMVTLERAAAQLSRAANPQGFSTQQSSVHANGINAGGDFLGWDTKRQPIVTFPDGSGGQLIRNESGNFEKLIPANGGYYRRNARGNFDFVPKL